MQRACMPKSGRKEGNFILACSSLFLFSADGDKSQQKSRSYRNRSPNHRSRRKSNLSRSCGSRRCRSFGHTAVKDYIKISKNISSACALPPNANTPDEACLDHGHRSEEDEQPSFLKGIDSLHDIGKSAFAKVLEDTKAITKRWPKL